MSEEFCFITVCPAYLRHFPLIQRAGSGGDEADFVKRTSSVSGSVMLSRKISRLQSWGQDEYIRKHSGR